ncbi:MAG TPA: HAMP domain-containing protein [Firmicutes bacterium]|nr:HAMP domain-containing protein [Bacillota bacterium]
MRINLGWKVSLVVSAVIIVAMALVGFLIFESTREVVREQVDREIALMNNYQWEAIAGVFASIEEELVRIAENTNIRSLADFADKIEEEEMAEFLRRQIVQTTGSHLERAVNSRDFLHILAIVTVKGTKVADSRYKEVGIMDLMAGKDEAAGLEHVGMQLSEEEYKAIPLGRSKEYGGENFVIHSAPILRQASEDIIGYLVGVFDIQKLFAALPSELGDYGTTVLLNKQGVVLNHPDKAAINTVTENPWYLQQITAEVDTVEEMGEESYLTLRALAGKDLYLASIISIDRMTEPVMAIARNLITIFPIALLGIFVVVSFFVRWQLKPLGVFVTAFNSMEAGHLNSKDLFTRRMIKRRDEIGSLIRAFIAMEDNLRSVVRAISQSTEATAATTEELASSTEQTSSSIEEVAAKTDRLSGSASIIDTGMAELATAVSLLEENFQSITKASTQVNELAQRGLGLMETTEGGMSVLLDSSKEATGSVINLDKATGEIENIVSVINEIAEQTNLLSLNAAIESARAGEHGRGFAVVANEIRQLAEQTRRSTENIVQIISELTTQTSETIARIRAGVDNVRGTKDTFAEIVALIADLTQNIQAVTEPIGLLASTSAQTLAEAQKQAVDSQEISAATQEQAALVAEIANAMDTLAGMANDLQQIIAGFTI